ncbi:MAG: hypothetical protein ACI4AN_07550 [Muribaculaceae bacterium]
MNQKQKNRLVVAGIVAGLALMSLLLFSTLETKRQFEEATAVNEQLRLQNEQLHLAGEYEQLNSQFKNYESQTQYINNDSILIKYGEAKDKVEKLLTELKTQKITSQRRIKQLQDEIKTLKGLMKHYVEIIDSLGKENAGLRAENAEIRQKNQELNSQVNEVSAKNENLSKRMTLAEKLNISALTLTPLKSNGKQEKRISKAKQLRVTFTIPQNNSTPVGEKTLYVRITNPEGTLLGSQGSFEFEGGNIPFTERKIIEYEGQEIAGISIYWNVNSVLNPGQYTVEVFADNYRLTSRKFTFEK